MFLVVVSCLVVVSSSVWTHSFLPFQPQLQLQFQPPHTNTTYYDIRYLSYCAVPQITAALVASSHCPLPPAYSTPCALPPCFLFLSTCQYHNRYHLIRSGGSPSNNPFFALTLDHHHTPSLPSNTANPLSRSPQGIHFMPRAS